MSLRSRRNEPNRPCPPGSAVQDTENPVQAGLHVAQAGDDLAIHERGDFRIGHCVFIDYRFRPWIFFTQLAARAGEREAFNEQEMLEPEDALDVAASVHARAARAL